MLMKMHFLGCGNSHSDDLGNSSAVFEYSKGKRLSIDFGFTAFHSYKKRYGSLPSAIVVTHAHLDHIGGLENLFFEAYFSQKELIKLYVPFALIPTLFLRLGSLSNTTTEGDANFFDAFQLIPVGDGFWHDSLYFRVFENRHHALGSSFGVSLPGRFLFSGDTKPIPEVINTIARNGEVIFHDLSLSNQPSHTYIEELCTYPKSVIDRCRFYHLGSREQISTVESLGYSVCRQGETIPL
jgi:ribonuclease BN (tRNA processing enzyme)